jgi:hypothetical protein
MFVYIPVHLLYYVFMFMIVLLTRIFYILRIPLGTVAVLFLDLLFATLPLDIFAVVTAPFLMLTVILHFLSDPEFYSKWFLLKYYSIFRLQHALLGNNTINSTYTMSRETWEELLYGDRTSNGNSKHQTLFNKKPSPYSLVNLESSSGDSGGERDLVEANTDSESDEVVNIEDGIHALRKRTQITRRGRLLKKLEKKKRSKSYTCNESVANGDDGSGMSSSNAISSDSSLSPVRLVSAGLKSSPGLDSHNKSVSSSQASSSPLPSGVVNPLNYKHLNLMPRSSGSVQNGGGGGLNSANTERDPKVIQQELSVKRAIHNNALFTSIMTFNCLDRRCLLHGPNLSEQQRLISANDDRILEEQQKRREKQLLFGNNNTAFDDSNEEDVWSSIEKEWADESYRKVSVSFSIHPLTRFVRFLRVFFFNDKEILKKRGEAEASLRTEREESKKEKEALLRMEVMLEKERRLQGVKKSQKQTEKKKEGKDVIENGDEKNERLCEKRSELMGLLKILTTLSPTETPEEGVTEGGVVSPSRSNMKKKSLQKQQISQRIQHCLEEISSLTVSITNEGNPDTVNRY